MRKLLFYLIATVLFLGIVPSYKEAATIATEPQVHVKLRSFLGDQSSISLKIKGSYVLNGDTTNLLNSDRSFTLKVESGTLVLYDGNEKMTSGVDCSITPVNNTDHAVINGREYKGSFLFTVENSQYVRPINIINLEDYVKGVVPYEVYPSWPKNALKAQAVAARTYAYFHSNTTINDTTFYQKYGGVTGADSRTSAAVDETKGEFLTYNGAIIDAAFSSSNGGKTENKFNSYNSTVLPYFKVQTDEFDTTFTWNATIHKQQIDVNLLDLKNPDSWWDSTNEADPIFSSNIKKWVTTNLQGYSGKQIKIVSIPKVSFYNPTESGRFFLADLTLEVFVKDVFNPNGELERKTVTITKQLADNMRAMISLDALKSNLFSINETDEAFVFSGTGNGHGVGMSQYGAFHRAEKGIQYKDILAFYYPGTALEKQYGFAPVVNDVTEKDISVSGKADVGSTVEVKVNEVVIGTGSVGEEGVFNVMIPVQKAGAELVATSMDQYGNVNGATKILVKDVTAPEKPVVKDVTDQSSSVTGEAEAGARVEVKVNGLIIGSKSVGTEGKFNVIIPVQKAGTELVVTVTDSAGNVSDAANIVVKDVTAPTKPTVNQVTNQTKSVIGEAEAGATAEVKVNGSVIGRSTVGTDRKFNVAISVQKAGTELVITVTDKAGNVSENFKVLVKATKQGWIKENGTWYYYDPGYGVRVTGWLLSNHKWYFLAGNGAMVTGWVKYNNKWYYLSPSGAMSTGWLWNGGKWYYLEGSGVMRTGWFKLGTKWYYFNTGGAMQTGWVTISGKRYYFNGSGVWVK